MLDKLKENYIIEFGKPPKILIGVGGRVNIIGEHTDYNLGFVFPFSIDKRIFFAASKSESLRAVALNFGDNFEIKKNELGTWQNFLNTIINYFLDQFKLDVKINIVFGGDLPIGAGVSSSSALVCGIVEVINCLYNLNLKNDEKINAASTIEHGAGVRGGKMDQFAIFNGTESGAIFLDCKDSTYEVISIPKRWKFFLINTNVKHNLAFTEYNDRRTECDNIVKVAKKYNNNIESIRDIESDNIYSFKQELTDKEKYRLDFVLEENNRVKSFINYMKEGRIREAGRLLNLSHLGLKNQYEVSCEELDFIVGKMQLICFGSRMMGGGFGGSTIHLIEEGQEPEISSLFDEYFEKFNLMPELIYVKPMQGIVKY